MNFSILALMHINDPYYNCIFLKEKKSDYVYIHKDNKKYIFRVMENKNINDFMNYVCMGSLSRKFLNVNTEEKVELTEISDIEKENVILLDTLEVNIFAPEDSIKKTLLDIPLYKNMIYAFKDDEKKKQSANLIVLNQLENNRCYMIHKNTKIIAGTENCKDFL